MTTIELIAEIVGFVAIGIGFLIFQQKKRSGVLALKLSSDVLWVTHFLLLGAMSGMVLTIVGVLRSIVFLILVLKGKETKPALLLLFSTVGVSAIIITWKNVYSICSVITCVLATLGFWMKNPVHTKIIAIFVCMSQITYAICIGSVSVVFNELITLSSIAIFFARVYAEKKLEKKSEQ